MLETILTGSSVPETFLLSTLLYVYLAGVLTSFTPCIYPLIPVTLSVFGATTTAAPKTRIYSALIYCTGIASTYTILGIVSAQTGLLFGSFLQNPAVVVVIAGLLFFMALSSLDIVVLPGIRHVQTRASTVGKKNKSGIFLMGCVSGLVAAPCVSPVLAGVLVIAAESRSTALGGFLLFTYAAGISTIFMVLAVFSGLLTKIPRSGNWLFVVKFIIAVALFGVIVWLLQPVLGEIVASSIVRVPSYSLYAISLLFIFIARKSFVLEIAWLKVLSALLLGVTSYAILYEYRLDENSKSSTVHWFTDSHSAIASGRKTKTITMIDVSAEWCVACKELEHKTFPAPMVQEFLKQMTIARVDYENEAELIAKFSIHGLPCILFLDTEGNEIKGSRINGFLPPQEFSQHLRSILKTYAFLNPD